MVAEMVATLLALDLVKVKIVSAVEIIRTIKSTQFQPLEK